MTDPTSRLHGAMTAIITPFRDDQVDHPTLRRMVQRQLDAGIDGLVPCGTTGESAVMTPEERLSVIRTTVRAADGRVPIVAGTGTNDTRKTIDFTRTVSKLGGVHAALVVVPYYNKPDQRGLIRHFSAVADQGGLPVVLYNVPGRTITSLTPDTIHALAQHENIIAIKEASGNMRFDSDVLAAADGKLSVLSGDDFTTFPLLAMGGTGCISVVSNIDPAVMARLCRSARQGDWEDARRAHFKIQPLARALFSAPNPIPTKTIAAQLGLCLSDTRGPLFGPDDDLERSLAIVMSDYELETA